MRERIGPGKQRTERKKRIFEDYSFANETQRDAKSLEMTISKDSGASRSHLADDEATEKFFCVQTSSNS